MKPTIQLRVEGTQNLDPFGNLIDLNETIGTPYGFTGELVDGGGLLDLRARRYSAALGVFASLDPFEGMRDQAISLNRYSWVEGNTPNMVDPSGMIFETPNRWTRCASQQVNLRDCSCYYEGIQSGIPLSPLAPPDVVTPEPFMSGFTACQLGLIEDCGSINSGANCANSTEKSATVVIEFEGDITTRSLGTLADNGIWTHDHFAPEVTYIVTPSSPGTPPVTVTRTKRPEDNVEVLKNSKGLKIEGQNGTIFINPIDLMISYPHDPTHAGSLFLEATQFTILAGATSMSKLTDLGTQIKSSGRKLEEISRSGHKVTYIFRPGTVYDVMWNDLCVANGLTMELRNDSITRPNGLNIAMSENNRVGEGDLGGGLFLSGELIGADRAPYNYGVGQLGGEFGILYTILD